jgi:hypothetical protein
VCDGQETQGRGPAERQQKWWEHLEYFAYMVPLAPWERGAEQD